MGRRSQLIDRPLRATFAVALVSLLIILIGGGPAAAAGFASSRPAASALSRAAVSALSRAAVCGPVVSQPLAEPPWPLTRLRPDLAWPLARGAGMTVAVIDSGVSPDAPSLTGKVEPGLDYVLPGNKPGQCDENGHGTLIAGLIAGRETVSGGFRFYGMAPEATIVPVRVLRDQRRSFEADLSDRIASAVRWSVDNAHADVINLSLTTVPTPSLATAIRYALDRDVVVVAAAGNEGENSEAIYPAAYDGVITVAGVDQQDRHVSTSSAGAYVDVAAPGVRIAGPSPAGGGFLFSEEGGTSFAAGYVSGLAALIRSYDRRLTPAQVAQRITQTADHPSGGWNKDIGYGVINPARAVGLLAAPSPSPQIAQRLDVPPAPSDPDRPLRTTAAWVGGVGVAAALLMLAAVPLVRRGRARGWR